MPCKWHYTRVKRAYLLGLVTRQDIPDLCQSAVQKAQGTPEAHFITNQSRLSRLLYRPKAAVMGTTAAEAQALLTQWSEVPAFLELASA